MTNRSERNPARQADALLVAGRYELVEELERPGGLAGYRVRHALLDATLLLTALPADVADDPRRLARVQAAVRAATRLRHHHVVPVLDLVEDDGRYFVVEPLGDGVPLDRVLAAAPLPAVEALQVARQLAEALAYAHGAAVVHGTVCPAHVVVEMGPPLRACLSGFALVALAPPDAPIPARFLRYTAPERLSGAAADARGDVFAVGQLFFELFEGRPLLGGSRAEVETLLRDGAAPFVPSFSRVVPVGLAGLVARTVRRTPAERPEMAEVVACLRSAAPEPAEASPVTTAPDPGAVRTGSARPKPVVAERRRAAVRPALPVPTPGWRIPWPHREQRQPTFPSRVLVRARRPRAPLAQRILAIVAVAAIGRAVLSLVLPSSPPPAAVEQPTPDAAPRPEVVTEPAPVEVAPEPAPVEPPRIEEHEPADLRLTVAAGATTWFRVRATGRADDGLVHAWLLDGRKVGDGPQWAMVAPSQPRASTHVVEVEVTDGAGPAASRLAWSVEVEPAATRAVRRRR